MDNESIDRFGHNIYAFDMNWMFDIWYESEWFGKEYYRNDLD